MNRPTFFRGVILALVLSIVGSLLLTALSQVLTTQAALRLVVAGIAAVYVLYLMAVSGERTGRLVTSGLWLIGAGVLWFAWPPLTLYFIGHVLAIWGVRSLYLHGSFNAAVLDLGLNGLALAAGIWATVQAGSLFLALWCFFLVQAAFVAIPHRRRHPDRLGSDEEDRFAHAYRMAEAAARRISSIS